MRHETVTYLTENDFKDIIKSSTPTLIVFTAEWCGPCKIIIPVLERISTDYKDKIKIHKIDVNKNVKISSDNNIREIPTLIIFKGSNFIEIKVGSITKNQIEEFINPYI